MNNDDLAAIRRLLDLIPIDYDALDEMHVNEIMIAARRLDPTDSNLAADLRDAIRDNTYFDA